MKYCAVLCCVFCVCILPLISCQKMKRVISVLWAKPAPSEKQQKASRAAPDRPDIVVVHDAVITLTCVAFFYFRFIIFHHFVSQPCLDCGNCVLFLLILLVIASTPPTIRAEELKGGATFWPARLNKCTVLKQAWTKLETTWKYLSDGTFYQGMARGDKQKEAEGWSDINPQKLRYQETDKWGLDTLWQLTHNATPSLKCWCDDETIMSFCFITQPEKDDDDDDDDNGDGAFLWWPTEV